MQNISIALPDRPGALAEMGEALGKAGINLEGGGVFLAGAQGVANFLVSDGEAARQALEQAGLEVVSVREVLALRLQQRKPGQLGGVARHLADAGVNIEVQYSDHDNRLILVVDDMATARAAADAWMQSRRKPHGRGHAGSE
jgi:hypothetical protein